MKFYKPSKIFIIIVLINQCLSVHNENKRDPSSMEMINNFFTDTSTADIKTLLPNPVQPNKKDYSFKESRGAAARATPDSLEEAPPAATATSAPEPTAIPKDMKDWFMIASEAFKKIPPIPTADGKGVTIPFDKNDFRLSTIEKNTTKNFYFRLNLPNIYYSLNEHDVNILGFVNIIHLFKIGQQTEKIDNKDAMCFVLYDNVENWKVCSYTPETVQKWICVMKDYLKISDPNCNADANKGSPTAPAPNLATKTIQPIVVIPLPSRTCNDGWNYKQNGKDWECGCKEGTEQSPIDLPEKEKAIDSGARPYFDYNKEIKDKFTNDLPTPDGEEKELKIQLADSAVKISYSFLGKVVTIDQAVYYAQDIVFHTPSEHSIAGKQYDMEMQIHYGQSQGDIAKQVILSFLFEKAPGVYNKFLVI
jgi:hypothetical protein